MRRGCAAGGAFAAAEEPAAAVVHLATVLPALPNSLYLCATRKGGARDRLWMALMAITAIAAPFIRPSAPSASCRLPRERR